jgi:hypothetical protein
MLVLLQQVMNRHTARERTMDPPDSMYSETTIHEDIVIL